MNEQVDNAEYEFLWKLLANPADSNHSYIFNLQSLVTEYPQSGALRALLMPNGDKRHLKHAAAYFNPRTLHKLTTAPDNLPRVTDAQIVYGAEPAAVAADAYFNVSVAEAFVPPVVEPELEAPYVPVFDDSAEETQVDDHTHTPYNTFSETIADSAPVDQVSPFTFAEPIVDSFSENIPVYIEDDEPQAIQTTYTEEIPAYIEDEHQPYTYPVEENAVEHTDYASTQPEELADTFPVQENYLHEPVAPWANEEEETSTHEETSLADEYNAYITENAAAPTAPVSSYDERYFHQAIDDEVYDEIVSIEDIGLEQLAIISKSAKEQEQNTQNAPADANYFFEPEVDEPVVSPQPVITQDTHPAVIAHNRPVIQPQTMQRQAKSNLSNYNDDKMPYTFMWWLNKTRKEHANVYQPYASNSSSSTAVKEEPRKREEVDELQQQYYQNIVSHSPLGDLDNVQPKSSPAANIRKENKIIERFIQEEPQIKHPSGTKLDNENKAKRSSEDKEELVTETLARIYTEQMLYHKAILTYKKLMLKYPEKSLYFASQIEQLENKIN